MNHDDLMGKSASQLLGLDRLDKLINPLPASIAGINSIARLTDSYGMMEAVRKKPWMDAVTRMSPLSEIYQQNQKFRGIAGIVGDLKSMGDPLGMKASAIAHLHSEPLKNAFQPLPVLGINQAWQKNLSQMGFSHLDIQKAFPQKQALISAGISLRSYSGISTYQERMPVVDSVIRESIKPLSGEKSKGLYKEMTKEVKERNLSEVLPEGDVNVINTLSTEELKNRCYKMMFGVMVILMGTTMTTGEINAVMQGMFETLSSFMDIVGFHSLANNQNQQQKQLK